MQAEDNQKEKKPDADEENSKLVNLEKEDNLPSQRFFPTENPLEANAFDSYSTKKTIATGFFNVTMITTNFIQMKKMIDANNWTVINIIAFSVICLSLLIQFIVAFLLVRMGKSNEFSEIRTQVTRKMTRSAGVEEQKDILPSNNNIVTLLVAIISVLNIFVGIFTTN